MFTVSSAYYYAFSQAGPKFSQIRQSPAKPGQRKSKKKALIRLDFLCRFASFQGVTLTPKEKNSFPAPFLKARPRGPAGFLRRPGQGTMPSDFRKGNSAAMGLEL
jgi:hypothetical protein